MHTFRRRTHSGKPKSTGWFNSCCTHITATLGFNSIHPRLISSKILVHLTPLCAPQTKQSCCQPVHSPIHSNSKLFFSSSVWTREQRGEVTVPLLGHPPCNLAYIVARSRYLRWICFCFKPATLLPEYFWEQLHVWIEMQIWSNTSSYQSQSCLVHFRCPKMCFLALFRSTPPQMDNCCNCRTHEHFQKDSKKVKVWDFSALLSRSSWVTRLSCCKSALIWSGCKKKPSSVVQQTAKRSHFSPKLSAWCLPPGLNVSSSQMLPDVICSTRQSIRPILTCKGWQSDIGMSCFPDYIKCGSKHIRITLSFVTGYLSHNSSTRQNCTFYCCRLLPSILAW